MPSKRDLEIDAQTDRIKEYEAKQRERVQTELISTFILDVGRAIETKLDQPVIEYEFDFKKYPLNTKSEEFLANIYKKYNYLIKIDRDSNPAKLTLTHVDLIIRD